jgi:hypothetical protein
MCGVSPAAAKAAAAAAAAESQTEVVTRTGGMLLQLTASGVLNEHACVEVANAGNP